jgi:chemotaxis protein methyltransferase CheR
MDLAPRNFNELAAIIRRESGIVLCPDKAYLVRHRLEPLVRRLELDGFDTLVKRLHLRTGAPLRTAVIDAITVKETSFFRDPSCFNALREHVLPACAAIFQDPLPAGGRRRIRFWSAAAATGQEAYSLAMLLREFAAGPGGFDESRASILASDISAVAIEFAKAARYTPADVRRGLSNSRLHTHCHLRGTHWHINESVRRLVQFCTFNLLRAPTDLGPFDLILCRNVLIYFDEPTRRTLCRNLYDALQPGGWLVLGAAENLYGMEDRFQPLIHARSIIYRKPLVRNQLSRIGPSGLDVSRPPSDHAF